MYSSRAKSSVLFALRWSKVLGDPSISIHGLMCVCSVRTDHLTPSEADIMAILQPMLDEGVVKERFFDGQLLRHFSLVSADLEEAMAAYERGDLGGGDMMSALRKAGTDDVVVYFFGRLHDHAIDQARKLKGKA